jgi:hypothetical protein
MKCGRRVRIRHPATWRPNSPAGQIPKVAHRPAERTAEEWPEMPGHCGCRPCLPRRRNETESPHAAGDNVRFRRDELGQGRLSDRNSDFALLQQELRCEAATGRSPPAAIPGRRGLKIRPRNAHCCGGGVRARAVPCLIRAAQKYEKGPSAATIGCSTRCYGIGMRARRYFQAPRIPPITMNVTA